MNLNITITNYHLSNQRRKYLYLLDEVFHIVTSEVPTVCDLGILCTAEQFALFMVRRNELGLCNSFKDLKVTIRQDPNMLDVRAR